MKIQDIHDLEFFDEYSYQLILDLCSTKIDIKRSAHALYRRIFYQKSDPAEIAFQLQVLWEQYIDDKVYDVEYNIDDVGVHTLSRKRAAKRKYLKWLQQFVDGYEDKYIRPIVQDVELIDTLSI